jgi:competence protein ComEA
LQQLSGIGEKKAADIIKYREENGSFRAIEDLTKVSGIGEKTLENLKDSITI